MLASILCSVAPGAAEAQLSTGSAFDLSLDLVARVDDAVAGEREVVVQNGGVLRSGDRVQLRVRTRKDAYVYVVAYGSSNSALLLHPFSGNHGEAFTRAGEERVIPREGLFLPLDENEGEESLFAILSESPLQNLAELLPRMESHGEDLSAVTEVLRSAHPSVRRVTFKHIGARPLIGVGPEVSRRDAPPDDDVRGGATRVSVAPPQPKGAGGVVPGGRSAGVDAEPGPGSADTKAPTAARAPVVPGVKGISKAEFETILANLPSGDAPVESTMLSDTYGQEEVLGAAGSRIRALGAGAPAAGEGAVDAER